MSVSKKYAQFYQTRTDRTFLEKQEDLQKNHEARLQSMRAMIDTSPPQPLPHKSRYYGDALQKQVDQKQKQDDFNYHLYSKLAQAYTKPSQYSQEKLRPNNMVHDVMYQKQQNQERERTQEYLGIVKSTQKLSSAPKYPLAEVGTYSPVHRMQEKYNQHSPVIQKRTESHYKREDQEKDWIRNQKLALTKCLFKPALAPLLEFQQQQDRAEWFK